MSMMTETESTRSLCCAVAPEEMPIVTNRDIAMASRLGAPIDIIALLTT